MLEIDLFAEDVAHELVVSAIVNRLAAEGQIEFNLNLRCVADGHGRAISELKTYQRTLMKGFAGLTQPDVLLVVIDANCKGLVEARRSVEEAIDARAAADTVVACPDPHIERWLFADPAAFTRVVGVDQQVGRRKCDRDEYKQLLTSAVSRAGHVATLGGLEFAQDIIGEMDIHTACRNEPSLQSLVEGVKGSFLRRRRR